MSFFSIYKSFKEVKAMEFKKKMKHTCKKLCHLLLVGIFMFNIMSITAFAAGTDAGDLNAANINGALVTMFNFIKAISVPLGCIGIAMCAFSFFMPSEKSMEIAKKRLFHIGAALFILMLIPLIFKFSASTWRNIGWKPEGGNAQIIQGIGDNPDLTTGPEAPSTD